MISTETARTGHSILRFDGRLLASSVDPIREAQSWARKASEGVKAGDTVCVLGAGCGYHIAALKALKPQIRIVVAEPSKDVAAWVLTQFPEFRPSDFLVGEVPEKELETWSDMLFAVSAVLIHGPTAHIHPAWMQNISKFVLARDRSSFLTLIRARPELLAILDPVKIQAMPEGLVSIKTLASLFKSEPTDSQERRLWRVLQELVA